MLRTSTCSLLLHRHARLSSTTARKSFKSLLLRPELTEALRKTDIFSPNAIQLEALPHALAGEDVIVCAQTGSGKTLLFLLPILQKLSGLAPPPPSLFNKDDRRARRALANAEEAKLGQYDEESETAAKKKKTKALRFLAQPEAIVLVPTRELALQIAGVAEELARFLADGARSRIPFPLDAGGDSTSAGSGTSAGGDSTSAGSGGPSAGGDSTSGGAPKLHPVTVLTLSNGQRFTPERDALRKREGGRLVIATPARLLYHMENHSLSLRRVRIVAVDEADAVLCGADGVMREGAEVLAALRKVRARVHGRTIRRQLLLTAATIGAEHDNAISALVPKARRVSHEGVLVPTCKHVFHYVRSDRDQELLFLVERSQSTPFLEGGGTVIFCGNVHRASRVHQLLEASMPELNAVLVHGETRPYDRELALQTFREDDTRFLVASDVATRGLDFPAVRHVIMYDLPRDLSTFIHRAGRTARRGEPGVVTCLVKRFEQGFYDQLRKGESEGSPLQLSSGRHGRSVQRVQSRSRGMTLQSPEERRFFAKKKPAHEMPHVHPLERKILERKTKQTPRLAADAEEPVVVEFAP